MTLSSLGSELYVKLVFLYPLYQCEVVQTILRPIQIKSEVAVQVLVNGNPSICCIGGVYIYMTHDWLIFIR